MSHVLGPGEAAGSIATPVREELSDAELISLVRGGDVDAYGTLFARHRDAAARLSRQLVQGSDSDDLVSEAFAKVLNVLLGGGGPDVAFRPYLLTAVRRLHVDRIRATKRAMPTDDLTPYDPGVPFSDTVVAGFEGGAAAQAFASLPERWQLVLWHLEVEGAKPADIAPMLGMTANSVSALAYRAREGLRQAFLQKHTADLVEDDCRWTHDKLGAYVRKGLSRRDSAKVEEHLDGCRKCTAIFLELGELNSELAAVLGPIVLGGAAAGYLAATSSGGAAAGGFLVGLFDRAKDVVVGNGTTVAVGGAAVGVATVAALAIVVTSNGTSTRPTADAQRPGVTAPAPDSTAPSTTDDEDTDDGADAGTPGRARHDRGARRTASDGTTADRADRGGRTDDAADPQAGPGAAGGPAAGPPPPGGPVPGPGNGPGTEQPPSEQPPTEEPPTEQPPTEPPTEEPPPANPTLSVSGTQEGSHLVLQIGVANLPEGVTVSGLTLVLPDGLRWFNQGQMCQPPNPATTILCKLTGGATLSVKSDLEVGDRITARVALSDGRNVTLQATVPPAG
ncbi:MAG TPA: sigma-70 family RNA polymerase sigma factor [Marmoricola sp.]|jgi:RNA polymerase sigma factor (sigma-70 family)|nr:sigma-70 family RNA polymerase sigma factor [Marmoricola sp.]